MSVEVGLEQAAKEWKRKKHERKATDEEWRDGGIGGIGGMIVAKYKTDYIFVAFIAVVRYTYLYKENSARSGWDA